MTNGGSQGLSGFSQKRGFDVRKMPETWKEAETTPEKRQVLGGKGATKKGGEDLPNLLNHARALPKRVQLSGICLMLGS